MVDKRIGLRRDKTRWTNTSRGHCPESSQTVETSSNLDFVPLHCFSRLWDLIFKSNTKFTLIWKVDFGLLAKARRFWCFSGSGVAANTHFLRRLFMVALYKNPPSSWTVFLKSSLLIVELFLPHFSTSHASIQHSADSRPFKRWPCLAHRQVSSLPHGCGCGCTEPHTTFTVWIVIYSNLVLKPSFSLWIFLFVHDVLSFWCTSTISRVFWVYPKVSAKLGLSLKFKCVFLA